MFGLVLGDTMLEPSLAAHTIHCYWFNFSTQIISKIFFYWSLFDCLSHKNNYLDFYRYLRTGTGHRRTSLSNLGCWYALVQKLLSKTGLHFEVRLLNGSKAKAKPNDPTCINRLLFYFICKYFRSIEIRTSCKNVSRGESF